MDPTLVASFISAIVSFSSQAFRAEFKGLKLDDKQIILAKNAGLIGLGVFSENETTFLSQRIVKKLLAEFSTKYSHEINNFEFVEDDDLYKQVIEKHEVVKFTPLRAVITVFLIAIYSLIGSIIFLEDAPNEGFVSSSNFAYWSIGLWVLSIINGFLITDRKWAFVLSGISTSFPSGVVLLTRTTSQIIAADYSASIVLFAWFITSYIRDNLFLSNVPVTSPISVIRKGQKRDKKEQT